MDKYMEDKENKEKEEKRNQKEETKFNLFGVITHCGREAGFGHYTATLKDLFKKKKEDQEEGKKEGERGGGEGEKEGKWFEFNDSTISEVEEANIRALFSGKDCAYMLLYHQVREEEGGEGRKEEELEGGEKGREEGEERLEFHEAPAIPDHLEYVLKEGEKERGREEQQQEGFVMGFGGGMGGGGYFRGGRGGGGGGGRGWKVTVLFPESVSGVMGGGHSLSLDPLPLSRFEKQKVSFFFLFFFFFFLILILISFFLFLKGCCCSSKRLSSDPHSPW